ILPNVAGGASASALPKPFSPGWGAHTGSRPVGLFTSTAADGGAPSALWYAASRAYSMASLSRITRPAFPDPPRRSDAACMAIGSLLVRTAPGLAEVAEICQTVRCFEVVCSFVRVLQPAELDLHTAGAQRAVTHRPPLAFHFQRHAVRVRVDHSCFL